ncbi:unnamed protein product [Angiostrongylus costaricensis]|uniref:Reverse transcriptase domain-containing protein n=1 Tax=Angiostrongylus costaricensis TaxID=334426 RepID=A0A0R3PY09_ANGCS|nr:unnamed protein product [Angiostrongylus costaricensis]
MNRKDECLTIMRDLACLRVCLRVDVTRVLTAYVMKSFDVMALYTNVPNNSTLQAILEHLIQHKGAVNVYFLDSTVDDPCSIFRWCGKQCAQMEGLAMGQWLARFIVTTFMSKVEAPENDLRSLLYCRCIND